MADMPQNEKNALSRWTAQQVEKEDLAAKTQANTKEEQGHEAAKDSKRSTTIGEVKSKTAKLKQQDKADIAQQQQQHHPQPNDLPKRTRARQQEEDNENPTDLKSNASGSDDDDFDSQQFPGAVPVAGMGASTFVSNFDDHSVGSPVKQQHEPQNYAENLVVAQEVNQQALTEQLEKEQREMIRRKIEAESIPATPYTPKQKEKDDDDQKRCKRWTWIAIGIAVMVGIVCAIVFARRKPPGPPTPTDPPTLSDFGHVQQLVESLSGPSVYDPDSPQYQAVEWMFFEDPTPVLDATEIKERSGVTTLSKLQRDRYVIILLYFALGGPNWTFDMNFLTNTSVCQWPPVMEGETRGSNGIRCDSTGSIVKIRLDNNNLNGTIPTEIASIESLETISFLGNNLHGTIPTIFGELQRLEFFQVISNSMTGSIPDSFGRLSNLEVLALNSNQFTGTIPPDLVQITELETLAISKNKFNGTIPEFKTDGSSVQYLDFSDNNFEGFIPTSIMILPDLQFLGLYSNQLSGTIPTTINSLTNLPGIYLFNNRLTGDIPTTIAELDRLKDLRISFNRLNGTLPTEFGLLKGLEVAILSHNLLRGTVPSEFGLMTKLNQLNLNDNPSLSGTLPPTFSLMTSLADFSIDDTSLTGSFDPIFCLMDEPSQILRFEADCLGPDPMVNCTCCTLCCGDGICELNSPQVCDNYRVAIMDFYDAKYGGLGETFGMTDSNGANVTYDMESNVINCTCSDDGLAVSCNYTKECQSCNEDESLCGLHNFAYTYAERDADLESYQTTFQYTVGRNDTLTWEFYHTNRSCKIAVNGEACETCLGVTCDDKYQGFQVECRNAVDGDNGGYYSSCGVYQGGVFEALSGYDTLSWNGCDLPFGDGIVG